MAKRRLSTFERLQRGQKLSRSERKEIERRFQREDPGWDIVHENVAGIDVGNESHFVAIDPGMSTSTQAFETLGKEREQKFLQGVYTIFALAQCTQRLLLVFP